MEERITPSSYLNSRRWKHWVIHKCSYQHTKLQCFLDTQLGCERVRLIYKRRMWGNFPIYISYYTPILSTGGRPHETPQGEAKKNQTGQWEDRLRVDKHFPFYTLIWTMWRRPFGCCDRDLNLRSVGY